MILAAGRGERLRPLTDTMPKPLIEVGGVPLIVHQLHALKAAGITDVVINLAHLPEMFQAELGNGQAYGVNIQYSLEPEGGLETAGGIVQALPMLGDAPFLVVSGDVYAEYDYKQINKHKDALAHLILVDHPERGFKGDFSVDQGWLMPKANDPFTYGNIGVYAPEFFAECAPGFRKLGDLLRNAAGKNQITAEIFSGAWFNIGTLEELELARNYLLKK